jgi:N-acyl-D-aspartate/D-glutamate deacylase
MYNFPLRFLKYVRDAQLAGSPFMSVARGVHKLTADLADWFGLDAGYIRKGDRADVVIINPEGLNNDIDGISEAPMEGFGVDRLVKRNDDAVDVTIINGRVAYKKGDYFPENLGKEKGYGSFLENQLIEERKTTEMGQTATA